MFLFQSLLTHLFAASAEAASAESKSLLPMASWHMGKSPASCGVTVMFKFQIIIYYIMEVNLIV